MELVFELASKENNDEIIDRIDKHIVPLIHEDGGIDFKLSSKNLRGKGYRSSERLNEGSLLNSSSNRSPFSLSPTAIRSYES